MKPKHQRLLFVLLSALCLIGATLLILQAFRDNLVFFYSPTDISSKGPAIGQTIRVGGLVKKGSVERDNDNRMRFVVTDGAAELTVHYQGMVPTLFREEQGVIAEGVYTEPQTLTAKRILTKHDEKYMPKEVVEALKRSGRWQEGQ